MRLGIDLQRGLLFGVLAAAAVVALGRAAADESWSPIGSGCWKECCERWCEEQYPGQQKKGFMEAFTDQDGLCTCEPIVDWEAARREAGALP